MRIRLLDPPQGRRAPPILPRRATKSAPPFAGAAGRVAVLDPVLARTRPVNVIKTATKQMFNIDHINELRAELAGCGFTKSERRRIEGELAALLADRDDKGVGEIETHPEFYRARLDRRKDPRVAPLEARPRQRPARGDRSQRQIVRGGLAEFDTVLTARFAVPRGLRCTRPPLVLRMTRTSLTLGQLRDPTDRWRLRRSPMS